MIQKKHILPELLSPAGSIEALYAAVQAGADAVYFGGSTANARANAKNFSDEELAFAVKYLHDNGKRAYITLNTLHTDRELISSPLIRFAEHCCNCGADAFILQDIGLSKIIRHIFPEIKLHASTQMAGHNANAADELAKLGFLRMVAARELDTGNLETLIKNSPLEIEMFVHGALCTSHSGRCFMSFALGNTRSANRGMCGQPCRLKYNGKYLLSLKDLCLASHIEKIIELNPASLKIEGRMKPPEYVYHVTKIYRSCLDERRNAREEEIKLLSQVFSRQGFTDGYFVGNKGTHMYGVRTEQNKSDSKNAAVQINLDIPKVSEVYYSTKKHRNIDNISEFIPQKKNISVKPKLCLNFNSFEQFNFISKFLLEDEIYNKIYKIFIPVMELNSRIKSVDKRLTKLMGIRFPYVIFDSEENLLCRAVKNISEYVSYTGHFAALIDNIGHVKTAKNLGLKLFGNFGLNIANSFSLTEFEKMGFEAAVLSPELNFAQIRDIRKAINCGIIGYGKTHIMVSENCLIKNSGLCNIGKKDSNTDMKCSRFSFSIEDRLGEKFFIDGDFRHRNIIYNSVPVYLADKKSLYRNLGLFFIVLNFTDEKKEYIADIISDYAIEKNIVRVPPKFTRGYK